MMKTEEKAPQETNNPTVTDANSMQSNPHNTQGKMHASQLMRLFETELKDIYWAENALVKAIPEMINMSTSEELRTALTRHLKETEGHVIRLEKIFSLIEVKATATKCEAMEGLINEATKIIASCEVGAMRDAGIVAAAKKVEHYEIASYGTLRQFAITLGLKKASELIESILLEEKVADTKLSNVAMHAINIEAAEETA